MQEFSEKNFQDLFRQHHRELCNMAFNLVHDADAAKDIVQEVFAKLWAGRGNLDLDGPIKHYLFKATAHASYNHLRFHKKIVRLQDHVTDDMFHAHPGTDRVEFTELEQQVRQAIDNLPPQCKTIYMLNRQEGMKYQEIADVLRLSPKTVENQMGIALEKLRVALKPFITLKSFVALLLAAGVCYYILSF
jgi:RNA polymerase sigma-70 factor (ECF subfamily)